MKTLADWKKLIEKKAPEKCGVYLFKGIKGYTYIGKAKNIKKRLLQHLQAVKNDRKEFQIFAQSVDFDYIITRSEYEALVLERQLINTHKPKYNVVFKHGGGYPLLLITEEKFPTVKVVRDLEEKGDYFGPFFSIKQAKKVKKLIHQLFKLRTCGEMPQKGYLCMDYHLGLCSAPCVGAISEKDYRLSVESAKAFLSGNVGEVLPKLYAKIEEYAKRMEFEKCAFLKEQITALENIAAGQKVLNLPFEEADLWHLSGDTITLYLVRGKKIVDKKSFEKPQYLTSFDEWLTAYYSVNLIPKTIIVSEKLSDKTLLEKYLSEKSSKRVELITEIPPELKDLIEENAPAVDEKTIKTFEEVLKLPFPKRIEGFDISHFYGDFTVGSCVVWEEGKMNKKCYRRYRIKRVEGIDDYASMREILSRRAIRIKKGQYPVPDLWLIDGGKGQLSAALEVKRRYKLPTFVVALAKREEILHTEDGREIPLKEYPELYRIFGQIRDEAHRFALSYNRKLREKNLLGKLKPSERKLIERNFKGLYEVLETPDEKLKRLGINPELKNEIRKTYGEE